MTKINFQRFLSVQILMHIRGQAVGLFFNISKNSNHSSEKIISSIESTLLILNPITGRKHQIRKQLFSIGFPVIGDSKYNFPENKINKNNNLMLHSYSIKFMINEKKYQYTVKVPDYFKKMLLKKRLTLFKNT